MSGSNNAKAVEANIKKLMDLGHSKTRAQKALKDSNNNFMQAKAWLERDDKEKKEKEHQLELQRIAEKRELEEKRRRQQFVVQAEGGGDAGGGGGGTASAGASSSSATAAKGSDRRSNLKLQSHPCVAQYGWCRYGTHCGLRDLPGDTCINNIYGNCLFGVNCRNYHPPNVDEIRIACFGETLDGYTAADLAAMEAAANGEGDDGDDGDINSGYAVPVPEPSAWNGVRGPLPTHSDPVTADVSWAASSTNAASCGSEAPKPFLEKLKQGLTKADGAKSESGSPFANPIGGDGTGTRRAPPQIVTANEALQRNEKPGDVFINNKLLETAEATKRTLHPCIAQFGMCRFGDGCLHAFKPADICVHFLNGRCRFGETCAFKHSLSGAPASSVPAPFTAPPATSPAPPPPPQSASAVAAPPSRSPPTSLHPAEIPFSAPFNPSPANSGGGVGAGGVAASAAFWTTDGRGLPMARAGIVTPGSARAMVGSAPTIRMEYGAKPASPVAVTVGLGGAGAAGGGWGRIGSLGSPVSGVGGAFGEQPKRITTPFGDVHIGAAAKRKTPPPQQQQHQHQQQQQPAQPHQSASISLEEAWIDFSPTEERAFLSLQEAFPDTDPHVILHHLRVHGFDRHRVANAILSEQTRTDADIENALTDSELREREAQQRLHHMTPAARRRLESCDVLTLCALFPQVDRAAVEHFYKVEGKDFAGAVEAIACSTVFLQKTDAKNRWSREGPTQSEKLKMERLEAMFPGLPHQTIYHCFLETKKQTPKTVEILSQMLKDSEEVLEERVELGRAAMTGLMLPTTTAATTTADAAQSPTLSSSPSSSGRSGATAKGVKGAARATSYRDVATDLSEAGDWRRLREEARLLNDARLQLLDMAVVAYANGNGKGAKSLSHQAKRLFLEYKRVNLVAMQALEREQCGGQGESALSTLDLHGFYVDEALEVLGRRVQLCLERRITKLRIVTGAGNHSNQAKPVLFPAVQEELKTNPELRDVCRIVHAKDGRIDVRVVGVN